MMMDVREHASGQAGTIEILASKRSILIVEDDVEDQHILQKAFDIFVAQGIVIHFVNDGLAAMNFLSERKGTPDIPGLVVLDLNMPKLNGVEMLQKVKSDDLLKSIPVVVFSSSSNPEDIEQSKKEGATDYITKPSTFSQYKDIAEKFVSYM